MISNIIFKLDEIFDDIYFDLEEQIFANDKTIWCIFVSDLEFYLLDDKFKKWCKILRKKYPDVKWYCCFQGNKFNGDGN